MALVAWRSLGGRISHICGRKWSQIRLQEKKVVRDFCWVCLTKTHGFHEIDNIQGKFTMDTWWSQHSHGGLKVVARIVAAVGTGFNGRKRSIWSHKLKKKKLKKTKIL